MPRHPVVDVVRLAKSEFPTRVGARQWLRRRGFRAAELLEEGRDWIAPQRSGGEGVARAARLAVGVRATILSLEIGEEAPAVAPERPELAELAELAVAKLERLDQAKLERLDAEFGPGGLLSLPAGGELLALRAGGQKVSKQQRRDLLQAVRAGEVLELEADVIAFRQLKERPRPLPARMRREANARFVVFRPEDLDRFARSFINRLYLRDHSWSMADKGGKIKASELRQDGRDFEFAQTLRFIKPWAMEDALDGTLEEFSIGFEASAPGFRAYFESIYCTVCDQRLYSVDCSHWPGEETQVASSGERVIVEAEFRNPRGKETSGVTFPAVRGTRVEQITGETPP